LVAPSQSSNSVRIARQIPSATIIADATLAGPLALRARTNRLAPNPLLRDGPAIVWVVPVIDMVPKIGQRHDAIIRQIIGVRIDIAGH